MYRTTPRKRLFGPQDVIVEASLPQFANPTQFPEGTRGLAFDSLDVLDEINVVGLKKHVNVVGHHTEGVETRTSADTLFFEYPANLSSKTF